MRELAILSTHLIATLVKCWRPEGVRAVVAESLLLKQQPIVLNRSRERAPNLRPMDRVIAAACATFMTRARLLKSAVVLKPSTILGFHRALVTRKYRLLFTPKRGGRPGPKGPCPEIVAAIVEMKRRNPRFGYQRIAEQLALVFDVEIDKDVVRRVLAKHYRPNRGDGGPSWLSLLGNAKDSLWSVDLFRCESLALKSHWVMLVMDQCTRRIVGFAAHAGAPDGAAVCRMLARAIAGSGGLPRRLSTDHDPLFEFHRWKANLRILEIEAVKTVPYVPLSHPFVERLIGTVRREFLDRTPLWNARDLERKLGSFKAYYNGVRAHRTLGGQTPAGVPRPKQVLERLHWQSYCRGLYALPFPA
ncbi:MAG TPA: integrase core domain-containing protein [Gammaproteobacteria bacterium]|nr:integrase core domain-containing protein [Gammaproteobacteria bacterium]